MNTIRRTLNPTVKVLDAARGLVEYVASDETLDSYREIIRVNGWRFTHFQKNAPFVDSHNYASIDCLLGKVLDARVENRQLVETVQWAIDVPTNQLAQLGWRMTEAGYLRAVSVGFFPVKMVSKYDARSPDLRDAWLQQLQDLGITEENAPRAIYIEQEQVELSACVLGANPNALAKAYKAGVATDADLEFLERSHHTTATEADDPGLASLARVRAWENFQAEFNRRVRAY